MIIISGTLKECTKCGELKKISEYPKNGTFPDGSTRHRGDCKQCYSITRKLTKRKSVTKFLSNTKHRTGEEGGYDLHDWKDAMVHFRGCCAYCGNKQTRKYKLTRDHLVAVSKGGLTTRQNILPACGRCNSSKSDHDWKEWFSKQAFFDGSRAEAIDQWSLT